MHIFCSICKDSFIPCSEVHVTNCGHLYHGSCLSIWINQHHTCPKCRANLSQPFRVFFDIENHEVDPSTLEFHVETLSNKLRETQKQKKKLCDENKNFQKIIEDMKEYASSVSKKNDALNMSVSGLKEQLARLIKKNEALLHLQTEVETWKEKVSTYRRIEEMLESSAHEVNRMIESTPVTEQAVKQLCTYVSILKSQLCKTQFRNTVLDKENKEISRELDEEKKKKINTSEKTVKTLRLKISKLQNDLHSLNKLYKDYKSKYPEKVEAATSSQSNATKATPKEKNFYDLDLEALFDVEQNSVNVSQPEESDSTVEHWVNLVSSGVNKYYGLSHRISRPFGKALGNKDNKDLSRPCEGYAFDGFGGTKKIRLGTPTPAEEFKQVIKRKRDKKRRKHF